MVFAGAASVRHRTVRDPDLRPTVRQCAWKAGQEVAERNFGDAPDGVDAVNPS